jgi:GTPase SAR1 family protein
LLETEGRLVTLTGTGGAGKTSLSLAIAGNLVDVFPDGVWFVELSALTQPRLIPQRSSKRSVFGTNCMEKRGNRSCGAWSLFETSAIQRFHRDVNAGSHQAALTWHTTAEEYARLRLADVRT